MTAELKFHKKDLQTQINLSNQGLSFATATGDFKSSLFMLYVKITIMAQMLEVNMKTCFAQLILRIK